MNIRKLCLSLLVIIAVIGVMPASAQNVIRWRCTASMTSKTEGEIVVRAIIDKGWHLYGMQLPKGGPRPTVIDFSESTGIKFTGPFAANIKPTVKFDPIFAAKLNFWDKNVSFTRKFKLTGDKKDAVIKGTVTYMCCDDETCMPPKTENFKFNLK